MNLNLSGLPAVVAVALVCGGHASSGTVSCG